MVTYYDQTNFSLLPFYSEGATKIAEAIENSDDTDLLWNTVEKDFWRHVEYMPTEALTLDDGTNVYPLSCYDTYMAYCAKEAIEDEGYVFEDTFFSKREE